MRKFFTKMLFLFFILLFVWSSFSLLSSSHIEEKISGHIPENEIQVTKWTEDSPGLYRPKTCINVVTDRGDTLKVTVFPSFPGSFLVVHKDTYPLAIGKKVFVKMAKREGVIEIVDASLKPFDK